MLDLRDLLQGDRLPSRVQQRIYEDIEYSSRQKDPESLINMSLCFFVGFGVAIDFMRGLTTMVEAATAGEIRAKALVRRLYRACKRDLPPELPIDEWLLEAASRGSSIALEELAISQNCDYYHKARESHRKRFRYGQLRNHLDHEVMNALEEDCQNVQSIETWLELENGRHLDGLQHSPWGMSSLHAVALAGGDCSVVDFLVDNSANVNNRNFGGDTPLLCAIRSGNTKAAVALLRRGADPTLANVFGETPLHHVTFLEPGPACSMIQLLLDHGAIVDAPSSGTDTATFRSTENFLCEPLGYYGTPLLWAVRARRLDVVKELLLRGADPHFCQDVTDDGVYEVMYEDTECSPKPVYYAVRNADVDIVQELCGAPKARVAQCKQDTPISTISDQSDFSLMYVVPNLRGFLCCCPPIDSGSAAANREPDERLGVYMEIHIETMSAEQLLCFIQNFRERAS